MCALLVGLPDVAVVGVGEWPSWLRVVIATPGGRPRCSCGGTVHRHGVREVMLVDLPVFGRPVRLVWRKQRRRCVGCGRCWCDENPDFSRSAANPGRSVTGSERTAASTTSPGPLSTFATSIPSSG
jgi:hypothetical protein